MTEKPNNEHSASTDCYPLRRVVSSHLTWEGNPHQAWNYVGNHHFLDEVLECGHRVETVPPRPAKRRRCFDCYRGL